MRDGVDSSTSTAVALTATSPLLLVRLGFDDPVYLSSRSATVWGGYLHLASDITSQGGTPPTLAMFNDGLALGAMLLAQGTTGRSVHIWEAYSTPDTVSGAPVGFGAPVLIFSGEMSSATVGDKIAIQCKLGPPLKTPRRIIAPPVCNHLPAAGTRIQMPSQTYVLQ